MRRVPTIQGKAVEKIVRAATALGVTSQSLYEAADLSSAILDDPDARIPFAKIVSLYEQAAALTGDDAFGLHVGESVDPKAFDVLGYSVINSPTFGAALDRVVATILPGRTLCLAVKLGTQSRKLSTYISMIPG